MIKKINKTTNLRQELEKLRKSVEYCVFLVDDGETWSVYESPKNINWCKKFTILAKGSEARYVKKKLYKILDEKEEKGDNFNAREAASQLAKRVGRKNYLAGCENAKRFLRYGIVKQFIECAVDPVDENKIKFMKQVLSKIKMNLLSNIIPDAPYIIIQNQKNVPIYSRIMEHYKNDIMYPHFLKLLEKGRTDEQNIIHWYDTEIRRNQMISELTEAPKLAEVTYSVVTYTYESKAMKIIAPEPRIIKKIIIPESEPEYRADSELDNFALKPELAVLADKVLYGPLVKYVPLEGIKTDYAKIVLGEVPIEVIDVCTTKYDLKKINVEIDGWNKALFMRAEKEGMDPNKEAKLKHRPLENQLVLSRDFVEKAKQINDPEYVDLTPITLPEHEYQNEPGIKTFCGTREIDFVYIEVASDDMFIRSVFDCEPIQSFGDNYELMGAQKDAGGNFSFGESQQVMVDYKDRYLQIDTKFSLERCQKKDAYFSVGVTMFYKSKYDNLTILTAFKNHYEKNGTELELHEIVREEKYTNLFLDIDTDSVEERETILNLLASEQFKKYFISYHMACSKTLGTNARLEINSLLANTRAHVYIRVFSGETRFSFSYQSRFWSFCAQKFNVKIDMAPYRNRMRTPFSVNKNKERYIATDDIQKYVIYDRNFSIEVETPKIDGNAMQLNFQKTLFAMGCVSKEEYIKYVKRGNTRTKETDNKTDYKLKNVRVHSFTKRRADKMMAELKRTEKGAEHDGEEKKEKEEKEPANEDERQIQIWMMKINQEEKLEYGSYEHEMIEKYISTSRLFAEESLKGYTLYKKTVANLYRIYSRMDKGNEFVENKICQFFAERGYDSLSNESETIGIIENMRENGINGFISVATTRQFFMPKNNRTIINFDRVIYPPFTKKYIAVVKAPCDTQKTVGLLKLTACQNIYAGVPVEILNTIGITDVKLEKKKLCVITCRTTLADQYKNNTCGVNFFQYNQKEKRLEEEEHFIVQLESIGKWAEEIQQYDIVFWDEATQLIAQLCHLKDSNVHAKYFSNLEGIFRRMFNNQTVIFSSANINNTVYEFIELFGAKVDYDLEFKSDRRKNWKVENYEDTGDLEKLCMKWIFQDHERLFIGCFSKMQAKKLKEMILRNDYANYPQKLGAKFAPITENDIYLITGETKKDYCSVFSNMNEAMENCKVVIYTSCMSIGVSHTKRSFHRNVLFANNRIGLSSDEAMQFLFRNRNPIYTTLYVNVEIADLNIKTKYDFQDQIIYLECAPALRYLKDLGTREMYPTESTMNKIYIRNKLYVACDMLNFYENLRFQIEDEQMGWKNIGARKDWRTMREKRLYYKSLTATMSVRDENRMKEKMIENCWANEGDALNYMYKKFIRLGYSMEKIEGLRLFYITIFDKLKSKVAFFDKLYRNCIAQEIMKTEICHKNMEECYKKLDDLSPEDSVFCEKPDCKLYNIQANFGSGHFKGKKRCIHEIEATLSVEDYAIFKKRLVIKLLGSDLYGRFFQQAGKNRSKDELYYLDNFDRIEVQKLKNTKAKPPKSQGGILQSLNSWIGKTGFKLVTFNNNYELYNDMADCLEDETEEKEDKGKKIRSKKVFNSIKEKHKPFWEGLEFFTREPEKAKQIMEEYIKKNYSEPIELKKFMTIR
jgi:hypothetical protein